MTDKNIDYENPWIYKGNPFTSDDIGDYYGFVYRITNTTTQKSYIGRKYFVQKRKPREESVELQASQTGRSTTEALRILSRILEEMARILSEEKSYPSTPPLEK